MMNKLLIDRSDMDERVLITCSDVDDRLDGIILLTQDRYLREVLKDKLYFEFMGRYNNKMMVSSDVVLLERYIKPFLVHQTYVEFLVWDGAIPSPHGLVERSTDNAIVIDSERRGNLIATQRRHAEFYRGELEHALNCDPWKVDQCCDSSHRVVSSISVLSRKKGNCHDIHCKGCAECRECGC